MTLPIWLTPAGSLGTIPVGVFFQLTLSATDPDIPGPDAPLELNYVIIAGSLPNGIAFNRDGDILILHTGWHRHYEGQPQQDLVKYFCYHPGPSIDTLHWMLKRKIKWWGMPNHAHRAYKPFEPLALADIRIQLIPYPWYKVPHQPPQLGT